MPIQVTCSNGHSLKLADKMAGKRGKCPHCGVVIVVPEQTEVLEAILVEEEEFVPEIVPVPHEELADPFSFHAPQAPISSDNELFALQPGIPLGTPLGNPLQTPGGYPLPYSPTSPTSAKSAAAGKPGSTKKPASKSKQDDSDEDSLLHFDTQSITVAIASSILCILTVGSIAYTLFPAAPAETPKKKSSVENFGALSPTQQIAAGQFPTANSSPPPSDDEAAAEPKEDTPRMAKWKARGAKRKEEVARERAAADELQSEKDE